MKEVFLTIKDKRVVEKVDLPDGRYAAKWSRKDKRSNQQNRYLHGVMLPVIKEALRGAGWNMIKSIEDAKDFVKIKFLKYDMVNEDTGEVVEMYRNTSALTKAQFSELVQDVQIWLLEFFNINLPLPGEQASLFNDQNKAA
jgi:hypothetical protein